MMVLTQKINVFVFFVVDLNIKEFVVVVVVDFLLVCWLLGFSRPHTSHSRAKKTFRIFEVRWSKNGEKNGGRER